MAFTATDRESALRESVSSLLYFNTRGMENALDIASVISSVLAVVHSTIADFANESNRTRSSVSWNRLPEELGLMMARWLPHAQRVTMLGVSRGVRKLLLSDTSLWTTISLPRRRIDKTERTEFLQTMVPRSGHHPVDLEWPSACATRSNPDAPRDLILSILSRARTLALHPSYFQLGQSTFWTTPTPLLESLTISSGTSDSQVILESSWPGKDMPLLRVLRLGNSYFQAQPLAPWHSVVSLEAIMGFNSGWRHIWEWLPHLEILVAHVHAYEPPFIPLPPKSVRHVTLLGGGHCKTPERAVRDWTEHDVRVLQIFNSESEALCNAVEYLLRCDAGRWDGAFVPACCDERGSRASIVLRGSSAAVVVRSAETHDYGAQLLWARQRTTLLDKLYTLTLSGPAVGAMLSGCPTLPVLRALTVVRTAWDSLGLFTAKPGPMLRAPTLERLTVDMTFDYDAGRRLRSVPQLVARIGRARRLRDITVRLPGTLKGQRHATMNKVSAALERAADEIFFEYSSPLHEHDYTCRLYQGLDD